MGVRAVRRALGVTAAAAVTVLATAAGASAADGSIVDVERAGAGLEVSVDVPADAQVDLDGVTATVDGVAHDATATRIADGTSLVQRTTVLAIDTSNSMAGDRFRAAQLAATTFLETVPDDVAVGIVTFDSDVTTDLEPTTDRDAARAVVDGLALSPQTLLYDGVLRAVEATATEGQRSVLVLSDGADTSSTPLGDVVAAVEASDGVKVDVVALDQAQQGARATRALEALVSEDGEVIASDSATLAATFSAEAEVLARQVAVSIAVPAEIAEGQVSLSITLPSTVGDVVAASTVTAVDGDGAAPAALDAIPATAAPSTGGGTPPWLPHVGVGVFAAGLLVGLVLLVPARPVPMSAEERVTTYASPAYGHLVPAQDEAEVALTQQASQAVAHVLQRNRGLDDRIARRLEAAGSELKSAEWLLVHAAAFVAFSVVGLLLGGGNVVVGLLFMVLGVVGPWLYLGFRARKRRKAFNSALPETLQLMSGSLSAGLSLLQSVDTIVRDGAEPMTSAFRRVLGETRIGVSLEDAFDGVADRFDSGDFRWVVMAIRIQRQVGGNLAELLDTVAGTMREREYMRRQVAALAAEGKLSAIVLGGLPPLFLIYLMLTQRDYVMPLFTEPLGIFLLVAATLWLSIGIFWMSRMVKVEV